jgi:hypothetical protein
LEVNLMTLELNDDERDYLAALLESALRGKYHELHHTDTADFKTLVKDEIALIESLQARLSTP